MVNFRLYLRPETLAALEAMSREQNCAGSTPDGELNILSGLLIAHHARHIFQLGTYVGWSALVLADIAYQNGGTLVTVDPSQGFLEIARTYLEQAKLDNVTYVWGKSEDDLTVKLAQAAPLDAIYIDTTHHYSQTKLELEIYCGQIAGPATLVALHDASEMAKVQDADHKGGVKQAFVEWLKTHPNWQGQIYEPPLYPEAIWGLGTLWQMQK